MLKGMSSKAGEVTVGSPIVWPPVGHAHSMGRYGGQTWNSSF